MPFISLPVLFKFSASAVACIPAVPPSKSNSIEPHVPAAIAELPQVDDLPSVSLPVPDTVEQ